MKNTVYRWSLCVSVFTLFLSGCSTLKPNQVKLTMESSPPGAMIYEGDKAWGQAPVTLILTANESGVRAGKTSTGNMTAIWPSGARKVVDINAPLNSGDRLYTFSRPPNEPGLDKDLAYANQLRQTTAAQARADRQSSDAVWDAVGKAGSDYGRAKANAANSNNSNAYSDAYKDEMRRLQQPAIRPSPISTPTRTSCRTIGSNYVCDTY